MRLRPRGRFPSLLAWGLLVGGIALLITFPGGDVPARLDATQIPAAILFVVAGLVFGISHPDGWDWLDATVLGWAPAVAGVAVWVAGDAPPLAVLLPLMVMPGVLSGAGAAVAAWVGRRRAQ